MMQPLRIAVVHDHIPPQASPDELDTLAAAVAVARALSDMGHSVRVVPLSVSLAKMGDVLQSIAPDIVFNLVESLQGSGAQLHLAAQLFETMGMRFTGSGAGALRTSTGKLEAKRILHAAGVPTPIWIEPDGTGGDTFSPGRYIVKSVWEHASVGLDSESVVRTESLGRLYREMERRAMAYGGKWFAERYVHGREFNVALLGSGPAPLVLPVAETEFDQVADPVSGDATTRILTYEAKWDEASEVGRLVRRRFDFPGTEDGLLARLKETALACWRCFGLNGYARVDFRVAEQGAGAGEPQVIDVNANPCLSPDAGFAAMVERAGMGYGDGLAAVLNAAYHVAA